MARFALVALVLVPLLLLSPAPVKAQLPGGPPGGFTLEFFEAVAGPDNLWTFHGYVSGWPPGAAVWVELFGVVGTEVDCDELGIFSCTVQLAPNTKGTVGCYGVASNGIWSIFTETDYDTVG